jgi:hypothetical protein
MNWYFGFWEYVVSVSIVTTKLLYSNKHLAFKIENSYKTKNSLFFLNFLGISGVQIQSLILARQMLCHWSHAPISLTFCPGCLKPWSSQSPLSKLGLQVWATMSGPTFLYLLLFMPMNICQSIVSFIVIYDFQLSAHILLDTSPEANEDICTTSLPNQKPWLYTLLCIPSSSQKIHPATFLERKMSETLLNGTYKGHNSFLCSPNICSTVWMFITHQNSFVEILITKVTVLEGGIFWKMFQRTKLT